VSEYLEKIKLIEIDRSDKTKYKNSYHIYGISRTKDLEKGPYLFISRLLDEEIKFKELYS
jgi:hypothetical protein